MRRIGPIQRALSAVLGLSAALLLVSTALPHRHGKAAASHPGQSCQICSKIQQGFSAAPAAAAAARHAPVVVARCPLFHAAAPRALRAVRLASPRAPPVPS